MKKILFITQNLARTGSEMVLWYLLNHLAQDKYKVYVFCLNKGELFDALPTHVEKSVTYKNSGLWHQKIIRSVLKVVGKDPFEYQLMQIHRHFEPDLWYVNTIAIPQAYPVAEKLQVKVATHFHELLYAFTFIRHHELKRIINRSDLCIACSEIVKDKIQDMGHPNIKVQPSFIDMESIHVNPSNVEELRKHFGIEKSDFIWVISGGATYMKGLDYILPLLAHFKDYPMKIIWIGKMLGDGLDYYVQSVTEKKYPGKFFFAGARSADYYDYLALGNGLLLLSREESFSLVMVEAAYLGIPTISVKTGIAQTFIDENMGKVVDSYAIEDITKAMEWLHYHPLQDQAKIKTAAWQYSVQNQLPHYEKLLMEMTQNL